MDLKLNTDIHELLNFGHLISVNKTNLHQNQCRVWATIHTWTIIPVLLFVLDYILLGGLLQKKIWMPQHADFVSSGLVSVFATL